MNVVPPMEPNGSDIAQQLRLLADRFDAGEMAGIDTAMMVFDRPGEVEIYGWGKIDGMRCVGLLNLAAHKLMRDTLDWMEADNSDVGNAS